MLSTFRQCPLAAAWNASEPSAHWAIDLRLPPEKVTFFHVAWIGTATKRRRASSVPPVLSRLCINGRGPETCMDNDVGLIVQ
eukprot:1142312-Pelagomonas_calceolata.AAC.6